MPLLSFPDEYFQGEIRCGYYVEPIMKHAWAAQLEILERVKGICAKYGLRYFADFGTILGAVRHKGFIPWDDDLDITMPRRDLQIFLECAARELPETYRVINCRDWGEYDALIVRLVNSDEIRLSSEFMGEFHGFPFACGLDIFPLDYIPRDPDERQVQRELFNIISWTAAAWNPTLDTTDEQKGYLLGQVEELTGSTIDRGGNVINQLVKLENAISAMYTEAESDHVGIPFRLTYLPEERVMHPIADYEDAVELPFENTTIALPIGYEDYLKHQYGEGYMNYSIYPSHDYPFFGGQLKKLKEHLVAQGATLADIGVPDFESMDMSWHIRETE